MLSFHDLLSDVGEDAAPQDREHENDANQ
jgi:hypothetical protein